MLKHLPADAQVALAKATLRLPPKVLSALFRGRRPIFEGVTLDERTALLLRMNEVAGRPAWSSLPIAKARVEASIGIRAFAPALLPMETRELRIPGPAGPLAARLYRAHDGARPLLLFFHGGGFVTGSVELYDPVCRVLASESACHVLSLDYRLAPEHTFPAPIEDGLAAYRFARKGGADLGIDPERVAVAGDSAGGNLAAVLSQETVARGERPPDFQALIYPALDLRCVSRSHAALSEGFFLTTELITWFRSSYLPNARDVDDPRASPSLRPSVRGLPPALVVTAGFDPLRDEGADYVKRLRAAGVPARLLHYPDVIHGFVSLGGFIRQGMDALRAVGAAIRSALAR